MAALLFWLLTIACCFAGARYGGSAGRWTAAIYLTGSAATLIVYWLFPGWGRMHIPTLVVDVVILAALVAVAFGSRRWFPIWMSGLHSVGVISHFAAGFVPHFAYKAYFLFQGFWAIPMLLVFAAGAMRDWQAGIRDERSPI